jgi:hypothetical protein
MEPHRPDPDILLAVVLVGVRFGGGPAAQPRHFLTEAGVGYRFQL